MGKSKRPLSGAALQAHKRKRQRQQQDRPEAEEENQVEEETQAESSGIIQVEHPQDPIEAETQDIISEAKLRIQHYQKYDSNDRTDKQLSDILDNLPLEGREPFCKMILAAGNDEGLRAVIQDFKFKLLIPLKARGGRTPTPTSSQTTSSSSSEKVKPEESTTNLLATAITTNVTRSGQKKLKESCLARDGYKCVVTGVYDLNSQDQIPEDANTAFTECAHIIPYSMAPSSKGNKTIESVSQTWNMLYQCFPALKSVLDMSDPSRINDPKNAITLLHDLHSSLGSFAMAFDETENENIYILKTYSPFPSLYKMVLPANGTVQFTSHDDHFPLPDKAILAAHAAIARILHLTGMGEEIDKVLRDLEELSCPVEDVCPDLSSVIEWLAAC